MFVHDEARIRYSGGGVYATLVGIQTSVRLCGSLRPVYSSSFG